MWLRRVGMGWCLLISICHNASLADETRVLDILVFAGQSNAVGFDAKASELPADAIDETIRFRYRVGDPPPDAHDVVSEPDQWASLSPQPRGEPGPKSEPRQYGNFANEEGGFGPEVSFARRIAHFELASKNSCSLAVVKACFSGTSLADDWDPAGEGDRGACYRALVGEVQIARQLAKAEGYSVNLRCFVWVQGESDANANDAPKYAQRMKEMVQSLRRDIDAPRLPVLVGVNVHFHEDRNQFMPVIISQQRKLSQQVEQCRYVDTGGASIANSVHFDGRGTLEVGNRFASALLSIENPEVASGPWKRHVVYEGASCLTAVAGDFTGDAIPDIVCNAGRKTWLLVAPNWTPHPLTNSDEAWIHSECMDVDGDGDLDVIGTPYNPGRIVWLECPDRPLEERWTERLVDDQVHGVHGLLVANIDNTGLKDLLATSAQPIPPAAKSLVWYRIPPNVRSAERWDRFVFANGDAPGLTHYLGAGDIDGDGLPDAASAAKGDDTPEGVNGQWFAWWKAGDNTQPWQKELVADQQPGATNIHPADVNLDGKIDLVASRGHGVGVVWFERDPVTATWTEHTIDAKIREPHCLAVVDIDRDGDIDVATVAYGSERAVWYENDGAGDFTTRTIGENQQAYDLRVFDMDVDGDLDLVVAGRASNNVVWYENPL